MINKLY